MTNQPGNRTNVKVHVLAAQIVEYTASSDNGDNVTPITPGASRYQRPGKRARPPAG